MFKNLFFSAFLLLQVFSLMAQDCIKEDLRVVGSVQGGAIDTLSKKAFLSFRTNKENQQYGIWLALVTNLNGKKPEVHILDPVYYTSVSKTQIRPKYGAHETYARYHGLANSPTHYINKVLQGNGALIPIEIILPLEGCRLSEELKVNWVIKNRRYKYVQSNKVFTATLMKAEELLRGKLFSRNILGSFIDYDKRKTFQRPNSKTIKGQGDIRVFNSKGYSTVSVHRLNEFLTREQGPVQIVNKGTFNADANRYESYGILRYINDYSETGNGPNSFKNLRFNDIAIFSELPESILPVAGIVVLEPQTELSHVNILAKNRGTLNISINATEEERMHYKLLLKKSIVGFKLDLINKPVRLVLSGNDLFIEEISTEKMKQAIDRHWSLQPSIALEKPVLLERDGWILRQSVDTLSVRHIGAKAANYGMLEKILGNESVLPGYAIGFDFYFSVIKERGLLGVPDSLIQDFLNRKGGLSNQQISNALTQIRNAIKAIPLARVPRHKLTGATVIDELALLCKEGVLRSGYGPFPLSEEGDTQKQASLKNLNYSNVGKIRFRSSTNCEDLPLFNGAGLYQSAGCKMMRYGLRYIDSTMIWDKLKTVLSSLWLDKAFYEREYFRMDHQNAAMGIQINPAFSRYWLGLGTLQEWANGVALYQEKDGKPIFTINSQIGIASVTNPVGGELSESFSLQGDSVTVKCLSRIGGKTNYIFIDPNSKKVQQNDRRGEVLEELKKSLKLIFNEMVLKNENPDYRNSHQYAIDIEYKIMWNPGNRKKWLFIKQARPLRLH